MTRGRKVSGGADPGAPFSGAKAPRAGVGPEGGGVLVFKGFRVEFGLDEKGRPLHEVLVDPGAEVAVVEWLFAKARRKLEEALQELGYSREDVSRRPLEKPSPEKEERRRRLRRRVSEKFGKYVIITSSEKSPWYRLGLSLTDGKIVNNSIVIINTTKTATGFCVLKAWKVIVVTFHDVTTLKDGTLAPSLSFEAEMKGIAGYIQVLVAGKASKEEVVEFIAGAIDGDGHVDYHGTVGIVVSKKKALYNILVIIVEKYGLDISHSKPREANVVEFIIHSNLREEICQQKRKS